MSNQRFPDDPLDPQGFSSDRPTQRFDRDLEVDPELREGPASSSKVALFAVGVALVLGAVFYGLNNTSVKDAQTSPPAQTAQTQNTAPQPAPPGVRDVTPKPNSAPGMTTGSSPTNNK
jgi:hypothetical protein